MALSKISRTKESFKDKISSQSQSSIDGMFQAIRNFENFCMEKYGQVDLTADFKKSNDEEIFDVLQTWINWNKDKAPRTMLVYFSRVRKYLHYMGVKLNEQDIKSELDFQRKVDEELYGLTIGDLQTIFKELRYKHKVLFMCQLSGLMRIGETIQLRKKNLVLGQPNIIVKIPSSIAKNSKGRTTFFTKESSKLLRPLLKEMDDDDLVFGSSNNPKVSAHQNKENSKSTIKQVLVNAINRCGLTMKYESTGRYMITSHSFRAYGITKLSRFDPNFAKKIAGQKGYLLQYDRMTDEEKLDIYEKYEHELIIDTNEKQKEKIKQLESEKSEMSEMKADLLKMKEENLKFKQELFAKVLSPDMNLVESYELYLKENPEIKDVRLD